MNFTRIALWSGPRNVSTALMYSFAQRADTRVLDEPLFGCFLKHTGVERPSRREALATMNLNPVEVINGQLLGQVDRPVLFIKNMANHLEGIALDFITHFRNLILIRHPADVISSYIKQVEQPTMLDLAYQHQVQVLEFLLNNKQDYLVIDSNRICQYPEHSIQHLCDWAGISFYPQMLSWQAGPRPEDGVWAKYWYASVHSSTGFTPYRPGKGKIPDHLQNLLDECLPLYEELLKYSSLS